MADLYHDYESGSDNNSGDSFVVTATAADGATNAAGTTFTSASASFTSALTGRKINIVTRGFFTVTYVNSTTLTLSGNAGASLSGLTYNIGGAWKTYANQGQMAVADRLKSKASPYPTNTGINATWTNNSSTITLASALTASIHDCEGTAWTSAQGANCVTNYSFNVKQGALASQFDIKAGITGAVKLAYIPTTISDYSGYQQISFWFRSSQAYGAVFQIKLCSDTTGSTPVSSVSIPANSLAGTFCAFTIDTGASLGSGIQSVALYTSATPGAQVVDIDNIMACKASSAIDSLSLSSVISKNISDTTTWRYTGITASGTTLSGFSSVTGLVVGMVVVGTGIPANTIISSINSGALTIVVSNTPTGNPGNLFISRAVTGTFNSMVMTGAPSYTVAVGDVLKMGREGRMITALGSINTDGGVTTPFTIDGTFLSDPTNAQCSVTRNEGWWAVRSILGTTLVLDNAPNSGQRPYYGTTETVALWKREGTLLSLPASNNAGLTVFSPNKSGNATGGLYTSYSGGWDRATMQYQSAGEDGITWYNGSCGAGFLFNLGGILMEIRNFGALRMNYTLYNNGYNSHYLYNIYSTGIATNPFNLAGTRYTVMNSVYATNCNGYNLTTSNNGFINIYNGNFLSSNSMGISLYTCYNAIFTNCTIARNSSYAFDVAFSSATFINLKTDSNQGLIYNTNPTFGLTMINPIYTEGASNTPAWGGFYTMHKRQGVATDHRIVYDIGTISTDTTVYATGSTLSWKMSVTGSNCIQNSLGVIYPLKLSLGKIACTSGVAVTVTAQMRRDNTNLNMRLVARGGLYHGLPRDYYSSLTAAVNTWATVSVTFTPTETGVIELEAQAYTSDGSTNTNGWVDTMTVA